MSFRVRDTRAQGWGSCPAAVAATWTQATAPPSFAAEQPEGGLLSEVFSTNGTPEHSPPKNIHQCA